MKILVINCGSSSIKYKLYEMNDQSVLASGGIERVGQDGAFLKAKINGESQKIDFDCPSHTEGMRMVFDTLTHAEYGAIASLDEIAAIGHRIVAGGRFTESCLVDDAMMKEWITYMDLAPEHNPGHLKGYEAVKAMLPNKPNVFVFDTAFHQTMPPKAYMYAVPYKYYEQHNIRRWGAHGTSHRFVSARACEVLGVDPSTQKVIVCHIGNGASVSAVDCGRCVDTSMGLTPLEGLVMGTRSGDLDASVVLSIMEIDNLTPAQMRHLLNKESGMKGLTGIGSDMRQIEQATKEGNERAIMATELYSYRIKKYIGAYAAAMGGVDIIAFTAGVGEHQWDVRHGATEGLGYMGIVMDFDKNKANFGEEEVLTKPESRVKVMVVPTDEELLIAKDTLAILAKA